MTDTEHCHRCGQDLDPKKIVWLELNINTGSFVTEGTLPEAESQGCFAFGTNCAMKELITKSDVIAAAKAWYDAITSHGSTVGPDTPADKFIKAYNKLQKMEGVDE